MFRMKGVIPPMITPFTKDGDVDYAALKTLTGFLKNEVDGLFITGSYGSGVMMTEEERMKVTEAVLHEVGGKIPVIAMVGTADSCSVKRLTEHAVKSGVSAVTAVGPYYFKHGGDAVCRYYADIVDTAEGTPVYVYNNPQFQGYPMDLALLKRLKAETGVAGMKDATFNIMEHAVYQRVLKDEKFDVALGTEAMWLSARVLGCEAFIPGLGNAFPEICRKMYQEGMSGDYEACRSTQFQVNEMRDIMYLARSTQLAIYAMLEIRGIIKAYPRAPFIAASEEEKTAIRNRLQAIDLL